MKALRFKLCYCFLIPVGVCIDVHFILAYGTIGSYVWPVSTYNTFATVYKIRQCHYGSVGNL